MYEKLSNNPFLTLQLDYSAIYLILLMRIQTISNSNRKIIIWVI